MSTMIADKTTTMVGHSIFSAPALSPDERDAYMGSPSRLFHNDCGSALTVKEYGECVCNGGIIDQCSTCGKNSIHYYSFSPVLTDEAKAIMARPETMKDMIWYHATPNKTWREDIKENKIDIHAGTLMAAYERLFATGGFGENRIYALRLKLDAVISPFMEEDNNDVGRDDDFDVQGYYNVWEDCGSVSIMCAWDAFEVIESSTISKESLKQIKSPYNYR